MVMVKAMHDDGHEVEYYLDRNIKEKILDKAIDIVYNKNQSYVEVIDARSGTGKSTFAFQKAKYFDPSFTIDKVAWTPAKFIYLIENAEKGDCIVFDEAMTINSRAAVSAFNKAIIIALSQIRSRNIFIIICINSIFDLDKNIAIHRADVLFHLYTENDQIDGERRLKIYGRQKLKYLYITGKKYYNYRSAPNFFARTSRKYVFVLNEIEYEKRKRAATSENTGGNDTVGKNEKVYKIMAAKLITYMKSKGFTLQDCAKEINENRDKLSKTIVWARDNHYIGKNSKHVEE